MVALIWVSGSHNNSNLRFKKFQTELVDLNPVSTHSNSSKLNCITTPKPTTSSSSTLSSKTLTMTPQSFLTMRMPSLPQFKKLELFQFQMNIKAITATVQTAVALFLGKQAKVVTQTTTIIIPPLMHLAMLQAITSTDRSLAITLPYPNRCFLMVRISNLH